MSETYVYKKEVDWSLFNYGFAIPLDYQVAFKKISERYMERGESKDIRLYLNGKTYSARLKNNRIAAKFGAHTDIVQVRYEKNSEIAEMLRQVFHRSYAYIESQKQLQKPGSKKHIPIPEDLKEYLVVYTTEYDDTYILETMVTEEIDTVKTLVRGQSERLFEAVLEEDEGNCGFGNSDCIRKFRKMNRLIGDNLKQLYDYRCQICGAAIGNEYDAHIAEAHHIRYVVRTMDMDAGNQMILCPNHHSLIHRLDPVFDRQRLRFVFPNWTETKLILNRHLKATG